MRYTEQNATFHFSYLLTFGHASLKSVSPKTLEELQYCCQSAANFVRCYGASFVTAFSARKQQPLQENMLVPTATSRNF